MDSQKKNNNNRSPVDRARRFFFVSRVVFFCLAASTLVVIGTGFSLLALSTPILDLYISSLFGLATAVSLAYIGGSVVDYNGGFTGMFKRNESDKPNSVNYEIQERDSEVHLAVERTPTPDLYNCPVCEKDCKCNKEVET